MKLLSMKKTYTHIQISHFYGTQTKMGINTYKLKLQSYSHLFVLA